MSYLFAYYNVLISLSLLQFACARCYLLYELIEVGYLSHALHTLYTVDSVLGKRYKDNVSVAPTTFSKVL